MEKILLAIDAINPDNNALEFACYLGRLTTSTITGVLLENLVADEKLVLKRVYGAAYADWEVDKNSAEYKFKMERIENTIAFFKDGCISRGVSYSLHRDRGVPAQEMIDESRFADLLIVDSETSFKKIYEGTPTEFAQDILRKSECPVIIAPESFEAIDEIVFTYSDTSSSVFAIKQFTYLFPQLYNKNVKIITVNKTGKWDESDKYRLKEWLKGYYSDLHFEALKGKADSKLFDYLFKRENTIVVMGAYGRNKVSRFFKQSNADLLIKTTALPIFITHL